MKQKYFWSSKKAVELTNFLMPMLDYDKSSRQTAENALNEEWLKINNSNNNDVDNLTKKFKNL